MTRFATIAAQLRAMAPKVIDTAVALEEHGPRISPRDLMTASADLLDLAEARAATDRAERRLIEALRSVVVVVERGPMPKDWWDRKLVNRLVSRWWELDDEGRLYADGSAWFGSNRDPDGGPTFRVQPSEEGFQVTVYGPDWYGDQAAADWSAWTDAVSEREDMERVDGPGEDGG